MSYRGGGGGYRGGRGRGSDDSFRGRGGGFRNRFNNQNFDRRSSHFSKGGDRFGKGDRGGRGGDMRRSYQDDFRDNGSFRGSSPKRFRSDVGERVRSFKEFSRNDSFDRGNRSEYSVRKFRGGRNYRGAMRGSRGGGGGFRRGGGGSFTTRSGFISKKRDFPRKFSGSTSRREYIGRLKSIRSRSRQDDDDDDDDDIDDKHKSDDELKDEDEEDMEGEEEEIEEEVEEEEIDGEEEGYEEMIDEEEGFDKEDEQEEIQEEDKEKSENSTKEGSPSANNEVKKKVVKKVTTTCPITKQKSSSTVTEKNKEETNEETADHNQEKKDHFDPTSEKKTTKKKIVKKVIVKKVKVVKKMAKSEEESEENEIDKRKEENTEEESEDDDIMLECPHCSFTDNNVSVYRAHLKSKSHVLEMNKIFKKSWQRVSSIRMAQRRKQVFLDKEARGLHLQTFFCNVCKLNYRTLKKSHLQSTPHKMLKELLIPECKICKFKFKTSMMYDAHLCDIYHLKRKAKLGVDPGNREEEEMTEGDLDPSNFMVLDAVESEDDEENMSVDGERDNVGDESKSENKKPKTTTHELGTEFCKKVVVYYCELCDTHLTYMTDTEKGLILHCRTARHLQRFLRYQKTEDRKKFYEEKMKAQKTITAEETKKSGEEEKEELSEKKEVAKDEVQEEKEDEGIEEESEEIEEEEAPEEVEDEEVPEEIEEEEEEEDKEGSEDHKWTEADNNLTDLLGEAEQELAIDGHLSEEELDKSGRFDKFKKSNGKTVDDGSMPPTSSPPAPSTDKVPKTPTKTTNSKPNPKAKQSLKQKTPA